MTSIPSPAPAAFRLCRFEDADFLGELTKTPEEQSVPNICVLNKEAAAVWEEYGTLAAEGKVQHY